MGRGGRDVMTSDDATSDDSKSDWFHCGEINGKISPEFSLPSEATSFISGRGRQHLPLISQPIPSDSQPMIDELWLCTLWCGGKAVGIP